ncbi:NUDIX domain-containing protein [Streptomyces microflavus]|uniref:NUDIX domain-containing protein n=1 Tax=Streptomyces microflavus TaxID=1919 RepID=UPI00343A89B2
MRGVVRVRAEGYVTDRRGCRHWGRLGAAGLLLRLQVADGPLYLLQQRAMWTDHGGTWSVPGGAMRPGESPFEAARREAREELGALPALHLPRVTRDDHGGWCYHTVIADVGDCFVPSGGDGEGLATRWCTPGEIASLRLHPGFAATWPTIRGKLKELDTCG